MMQIPTFHTTKTMSSREVAELTGKRHDHVLRDIRNLIERGAFTGRNFALSEYRDASGKSNLEYLLDFDATMTLLVGYGMTYDAAKESLSKRGFKEKAVMENLPMNQSMNLGMNKTMSSREVAELTGKRHDHVLRDIKNLIEQGAISAPNFGAAEYTDAQGKPRPEYLLDFDATMTLVTGYNAVLRAKVIKRWRELEEVTAKPFALYQVPTQFYGQNRLLAEEFEGARKLAELCGLEGNQALLKADKVIRKQYNTSPLALLEIELKTPGNEALIIPSEMGRLLNPPISAKQLNKALAAMGLQEWREYKPKKFEWRLTDKGKNYGTYLDVGRKHSDGTPVLQIKWRESVTGLVAEHLNN